MANREKVKIRRLTNRTSGLSTSLTISNIRTPLMLSLLLCPHCASCAQRPIHTSGEYSRLLLPRHLSTHLTLE